MRRNSKFGRTGLSYKTEGARNAGHTTAHEHTTKPSLKKQETAKGHPMPNLVLSSPAELRLPLRWIAILHGHVKASLAATSGIATGDDVLKAVMAGADVVQVVSVLLRRGVGELPVMLESMQTWMREHEYESISQMKGSMSQKACPEPAAFERANYMKTLNSYR
jgi:dihydroorotate dehydrogenase (fumarate)